MNNHKLIALLDKIHQRREAGNYPFFRCLEWVSPGIVSIDGQRKILVGSSDYLGLNHDPRIKDAAIGALEKYGSNCSGSRLTVGNIAIHEELESRLARFLNKEKALIFPNGYLTNVAAIPALAPDQGTCIFYDAWNHPSLSDGCLLSKGKKFSFPHNDFKRVSSILEKITQTDSLQDFLFVVEGVNSYSGDLANLDQLNQLLGQVRNNAILYVDDSHGLGVMGSHGKGSLDSLNLNSRNDVIMGSFSKSFASTGGFLASSREMIEALRHNCRGFVFSAGLPPSSAAAALQSLKIIEAEPERIARLRSLTEIAKIRLKQAGLRFYNTDSAIISLLIGDDEDCFNASHAAYERGVIIPPMVYPAAPHDCSILRLSFTSNHTDEDFSFVLQTLIDILQPIKN